MHTVNNVMTQVIMQRIFLHNMHEFQVFSEFYLVVKFVNSD